LTNGQLTAPTFGEKQETAQEKLVQDRGKKRIESGTVEQTVGKATLKMIAAGR
jgi:hypothetical protein